MSRLLRRLHDDERGLTKLEWLGIVLAVFILLSLIPQFRAGLADVYDWMVGRHAVDDQGNPTPGVLVRGLIVAVGALAAFVGPIWLINYTNLGSRIAFLISGAAFFGFLAIVGLLYTLYAPRGLRPVLIEGLDAFQIRILPGALMIGSIILFIMFVAALSRLEAEQEEPSSH
jgi:Flp pilus assembly pilin Flp